MRGTFRSRARRAEEGKIAVEYAVILSLVVLLAIVAWQTYQGAIEEDAAGEFQTFGYPPGE
ncbi:MAG: hypothetical protein AAGH15_28270 [Myxococcota bacterium]